MANFYLTKFHCKKITSKVKVSKYFSSKKRKINLQSSDNVPIPRSAINKKKKRSASNQLGRNSWQGQALKRKHSYETEFLVERKNSVTRFVRDAA